MNDKQESNKAVPVSGNGAGSQRRPPAVLRPAYRGSTQAEIRNAYNAAGYVMAEVDEAAAVGDDHIEMLRQSVDERRAVLEEISQEVGADSQRTVGFRVDGRFTPAQLMSMGVFPASDSFREIDDMRGGGSLMGSATVGASSSIFETWSGEHSGPLYQYVLDLEGIDVASWVDGDGAAPVPETGVRDNFDGMDEIHIGPVPVSRVGLLDSLDPESHRLIAELVGANLHNDQRGVPLDTFVAYQQWSRTPDYTAARAGGRNPALEWAGAPQVPAIEGLEERDAYRDPMQRFLEDVSRDDGPALAAVAEEIDRLRHPGAWNIQASDLVPSTVVRLPSWPAQRGLVIYNERTGTLMRYDAQGNESANMTHLDPVNDVHLIRSVLETGSEHYDVGQLSLGPEGLRAERTTSLPADGDCLINALLHAEPRLASGEARGQTLRHQLADYMMQDIDSYRHFFDLGGPTPMASVQPRDEAINPDQVVENLIHLCGPVNERRRARQVAEVAQQLADLADASPGERAHVLFNPDVTLGLVRLARNEALSPPAGSGAHSNAVPFCSMVEQLLRGALPHATDAAVRSAIAGQATQAQALSGRQSGASVLQELLPGRGHPALRPLAQLIYQNIASERCSDLLKVKVYDESSRNFLTGSPKRRSLEKALAKEPVIGSSGAAQASPDRSNPSAKCDLQALNAQIQRNVGPQQERAERVHAAGVEASTQQHQREAIAQVKRQRVIAASGAALATLLTTNQRYEDRRQAQYADAKEHSARLRAEQRDRQEAARKQANARSTAQTSAFNLAEYAEATQRQKLRQSRRDAVRQEMSRSSMIPSQRSITQEMVRDAGLGGRMTEMATRDAAAVTLPAQAATSPTPMPLQIQQQIIQRADGTNEHVSVMVSGAAASNPVGRPLPRNLQAATATPVRAEAPSDGGRMRGMADIRRDQEREQASNRVALVQPAIRIPGPHTDYVPCGPVEAIQPPARIPGPPVPWVPAGGVTHYVSRGSAQVVPPVAAGIASPSRVAFESTAVPLGGSRQGAIEERQAVARQNQQQRYEVQSGASPSTSAGRLPAPVAGARQQRIDEATADATERRRAASSDSNRGMQR